MDYTRTQTDAIAVVMFTLCFWSGYLLSMGFLLNVLSFSTALVVAIAIMFFGAALAYEVTSDEYAIYICSVFVIGTLMVGGVMVKALFIDFILVYLVTSAVLAYTLRKTK